VLARRRRILVALLAAPWVLWAIVRTFGLDDRFPLVALVAFTPFVALMAFVPLVVALVAREWAVAAAVAAVIAALAIAIVPRALPGPQLAATAPAARTLVVMSSNLRFGRADTHSIVALVRRYRVDVLSLLELSPGAIRRLDAAGLRALLPGRVLAPKANARGIGLMARRPLTAIGRPEPLDGRVQSALDLPGGRSLRIVAVHPLPPTSGAATGVWQSQLRDLPGAAAGGVPHILLGDFNGTLDNRDVRDVLDRGYVDAADATGTGLRSTFPVGRRIPPITIDHVLLPPDIRVHRMSVHEIPGSDHRALIAELVLPPG
jgi:endonuclease/exonuclease/phosphatase (EEP) superfamily protein YafD